jgi:hypothetical protein
MLAQSPRRRGGIDVELMSFARHQSNIDANWFLARRLPRARLVTQYREIANPWSCS